jgi:hypothetical protein
VWRFRRRGQQAEGHGDQRGPLKAKVGERSREEDYLAPWSSLRHKQQDSMPSLTHASPPSMNNWPHVDSPSPPLPSKCA